MAQLEKRRIEHMNPLISVIIPYYKGENYVAETLQSIFDQNYSNLEIIVVNDGSPDEMLRVFDPFLDRIKIISQENQGQAAARNTGIKHAQGELVAFLDSDDLWTPNHLELMMPHLAPETEYDFVRGMTDHFRINEDGTREHTGAIFLEMLLGAMLYRKSAIDQMGYLNASMREGEDLDWVLRLRESGLREKRLDDVVLLYRRHNTNYSNSYDFIKKGQLLSIRKKLERARLAHNS